jgi:hypothetical protein
VQLELAGMEEMIWIYKKQQDRDKFRGEKVSR